VGAKEDNVTVVSLLRLSARPGADLPAAFAALGIFEQSRESGGFRGGRLLREIGGEGFLVIAEWDDPSAYQGWLDNPIRDELGAQLEPLLTDDVASGEIFEEV
jgi:heme-degrading monooxygenase HmoA